MAYASKKKDFNNAGTSNESIASYDRQCRAWTQKPGNSQCLNNKRVDMVKDPALKTHADIVADELCATTHKKDVNKFIVSVLWLHLRLGYD